MEVNTNAIVQRFTPPGRLKDFTETQKDQWHQLISDMFDQTVKGYTQWPPDGTPRYIVRNNAPRPQFFNPSTTFPAPDLQQKKISWVGFPKKVSLDYPTDIARWRKADQSRDVQDEYCEWSVSKNKDDEITSVTFTCEGPEYWEFLGETNPSKVVELYQQYVSQDVKEEDLFQNGRYIPRNRWNNDTMHGAMHLIQSNNSLFAEVELAGGASMVRAKEGRVLDEQQELIEQGLKEIDRIINRQS